MTYEYYDKTICDFYNEVCEKKPDLISFTREEEKERQRFYDKMDYYLSELRTINFNDKHIRQTMANELLELEYYNQIHSFIGGFKYAFYIFNEVFPKFSIKNAIALADEEVKKG